MLKLTFNPAAQSTGLDTGTAMNHQSHHWIVRLDIQDLNGERGIAIKTSTKSVVF